VPLSEIPVELWILKILANSSHQTGKPAIPRHPDLQTAHLLLWLMASLNRTSSKPDGQVWIQDPHLDRFVIGAGPTLRIAGPFVQPVSQKETPGVSRPCIWSTMHLSGLSIAYPECPFGPLWINLETGDDPLDIVVMVSIQQFCEQLDIQLDDFSVESAMEMDSDVIFIDIFIDYYIIIR